MFPHCAKLSLCKFVSSVQVKVLNLLVLSVPVPILWQCKAPILWCICAAWCKARLGLGGARNPQWHERGKTRCEMLAEWSGGQPFLYDGDLQLHECFFVVVWHLLAVYATVKVFDFCEVCEVKICEVRRVAFVSLYEHVDCRPKFGRVWTASR